MIEKLIKTKKKLRFVYPEMSSATVLKVACV